MAGSVAAGPQQMDTPRKHIVIMTSQHEGDQANAEAGNGQPRFLHEEPGGTVFEGDVLKIEHLAEYPESRDYVDYDVQNGGWASDGPNAPDTWLTEGVLARFNGRRVRVTIEDLGPSTRLPAE